MCQSVFAVEPICRYPNDVSGCGDIIDEPCHGEIRHYRRWSSREELIAATLDSVRTGIEMTPSDSRLEAILSAYEQAAVALDSRVETLVKKRVALGLECEALSLGRHVSRRCVPIANEIRRSIDSGELDPSLDVEAMIDLYYYQCIIRGRSIRDEDETRARMRQP